MIFHCSLCSANLARTLNQTLYCSEIKHGHNSFRPECTFRKQFPDEAVFEHQVEPVGDHVLEVHGMVVATGGFLTHYNPPFADLYLEVRQDYRDKGFGSFFLQEIKKECYHAKKIPCARCNVRNEPSRMALHKSGMEICGYMLKGDVLLS